MPETPAAEKWEWTPEREAALRQHWANGLSGAEIARAMGAPSRNIVISKAWRMELPARGSGGQHSKKFQRISGRIVVRDPNYRARA